MNELPSFNERNPIEPEINQPEFEADPVNQPHPDRDGTWPMAGLGHEEVVVIPAEGHKRSLLSQRMIQAGRRNPALAHLFTEDSLPAELRGFVD